MANPSFRATPKRQAGAAMAIGLILLLVLTLLSVGAMQSAVLEERMGGNFRDHNLAFQAAETATQIAQQRLQSGTQTGFNCTGGFYPANDANCDGAADNLPVWRSVNWGNGSAQVSSASGIVMAGLASLPQYIVEEIQPGSVGESNVAIESGIYRITARGVGGSAATVVMLQSTYIP